MKLPKKCLSNTPLLALTAANFIPLFGAIFWGWNAFNIVFPYWAENFAVGFYSILKIAVGRCRRDEFFGKILAMLFFTIPYGRMVVMHIAIIAGAFLTITLGSPLGLLVVLIALKTAIDVKLHLWEHKKAKP